MSTTKKIAIIGSGPAGLTAAIYTARAGVNTTIFMGSQPGGQLTTTTEIENFPGAWSQESKEGLLGPELMSRITEQASHFGAILEYQDIAKIEKISLAEMASEETPKKTESAGFKLTSTFGDVFHYDAIIIATGASARYLNLPDEERWIGRGYHTCATCDGFFYKDKVVCVVGGGDSAMEEASYLSKLASKVYLIHRREEFKASKIMLERAQNNPKIEFLLWQSPIDFIITDNKITGIKLENTQNKTITNVTLDAVFVAVGHVPNSSFVKDVLTVDEAGYLISRASLLPAKIALGDKSDPKIDANWAKYSKMSEIEGIFIAGDIEDKVYRQAISAAGDGCRAAIDCERWLEEQLT